MVTSLLLGFWMFLTILTTVGGVIGWYQLRTDHHRVSLYLSRILIAIALRSLITFIGIYIWAATLGRAPIFIAFSTLGATLLCGAIWGWLLYLRGIVNGGGWRDLWKKGTPK